MDLDAEKFVNLEAGKGGGSTLVDTFLLKLIYCNVFGSDPIKTLGNNQCYFFTTVVNSKCRLTVQIILNLS